MDGARKIPAPDSIIALLASLDFDKTIAFYEKLDFFLVSRHDDYLLIATARAGRSCISG